VPDWASALLGAAIGGLAAIGGAYLQAREARRARDAERREGGARLVGRVQSVLRECDPEGPPPADPAGLKWRWGELRLELDILAASYPAKNVPELTEQLIRRGDAVLQAPERRDGETFAQASAAAAELLAEIRRR
jgi:hypothetical protein